MALSISRLVLATQVYSPWSLRFTLIICSIPPIREYLKTQEQNTDAGTISVAWALYSPDYPIRSRQVFTLKAHHNITQPWSLVFAFISTRSRDVFRTHLKIDEKTETNATYFSSKWSGIFSSSFIHVTSKLLRRLLSNSAWHINWAAVPLTTWMSWGGLTIFVWSKD